MGTFKALASIIVVFALSGCAAGARSTFMEPLREVELQAREGSPFVQNVAIGLVDGGQETNPMWTSEVGSSEFREALRRALLDTGYLSPRPNSSTFILKATIGEVDQPLIGFDMTVRATVYYRLLERPNEKRVFEEMITSSHTVSVGDAFIGVERLRMANEGAMRKNIEAFLELLQGYDS